MHAQRIYKTNIDYPRSLKSLRSISSSFSEGEKGQCTLRLKDLREIRVQLTVNGFLKFHSGNILDDSDIIRTLAQHVKTQDDQSIQIELHRYIQSDSEMLRWRRATSTLAIGRQFFMHPWLALFLDKDIMGKKAGSSQTKSEKEIEELYRDLSIEQIYLSARFWFLERLRFSTNLLLGEQIPTQEAAIFDALLDIGPSNERAIKL